MFNTNKFLKEHTKLWDMVVSPYEDGDFYVSIQASEFHHCYPRKTDADYYFTVELGFPSEVPPDYILKYATDREDPLNCVYHYVPVEEVDRWLTERNYWPDVIE